jgi:hypothetical protein
MADSIKHGIQQTGGGKSIEYGKRSPSSDWERRPYGDGDKPATYKFDKQSGPGPSGHAATQTKGLGKHSSIGGSSAFVPKGKVSSLGKGNGKFGTMKSGLSGQLKGHGA